MLNKTREDFEVLKKGIIYFDSACMSLKPKQVVNAMLSYYNEFPGCAGRSMHKIGKKVEEEVAKSRKKVKDFINAKKESEIIFTKNTTESINLVANSFKFDKCDIVVSSDREHNSSLLPFLNRKDIKYVPVDSKEDFTFDLEKFGDKVKNARFVSIVHTSNLDGYTLPVKEIIKIAHENGALVMLDGAQSVPHKKVDVKKLDVDFLCFSGHKMLGPTGIGVLYGKEGLLKNLNPFLVGGDTVVNSSYTNFELEKVPERFEAGLQNYSGIIGLGAAVDYLKKIGMENVEKHEEELGKYLLNNLHEEVDLVGVKDVKGIFSFNIGKISPHDVAMLLDQSKKIMIRSGAHCVHSWFNKHKINGSARASFYIYNTKEEINVFLEELKKVVKYFK